MSNNTDPAWVTRLERATDVGGHADINTGYRCSGFEANAIAKEWRLNQARITELKQENERLQKEVDLLEERLTQID